MKIIKQYLKTEADEYPYHCCIFTNTYGHSYEHIKMLAELAKRFDNKLSDDEINVMYYSGERYKRTVAVEFKTLLAPDSSWTEISRLEPIL